MDEHYFLNGKHDSRFHASRHKHRKSGGLSGMIRRGDPRIECGEQRYLILDTLVRETYPFETAKRYIL